MDPDDLIDSLGIGLAGVYARAEADILAIIARRVYRDLDERTSDAERLRAVRQLRAEAERVIEALPEDIAIDVIRVAQDEGAAFAAARLGLAKFLPVTVPFTTTSALAVAALAVDLGSKLEALHLRMTRYPEDAYQRLIADIVPGVVLGTEGTIAAQKRAVAQWLGAGIPGFIDSAGRGWKPGSYVEMATRTSVTRAFNDSAVVRMQRSGINLVTPSGGVSACHLCRPWHGKVLSTDGTPAGVHQFPHATGDRLVSVRVDATLAAAREAGLNHPNCQDVMVSVLPGLTIPAGPKPNPAKDEARQKQRGLERAIRDEKRVLEVTDVPEDARELRRRIREMQRTLRAHVEANDLPRMPWREQLAFSDGKPVRAEVAA